MHAALSGTHVIDFAGKVSVQNFEEEIENGRRPALLHVKKGKSELLNYFITDGKYTLLI